MEFKDVVKNRYSCKKYVNSLSKAELQQLYYDALIELEDRRRNYW